MRRVPILLLSTLIPALALAEPPPPSHARNGRFEAAADDGLPKDWFVVGDGGELALDPPVGAADGRSLRLRMRPGAKFTGIGQRLDASPWSGKAVVVRARLRSEAVPAEALRVWIRADEHANADRGFVSAAAPANDGGWVAHEATLDIVEGARHLVFGITLHGPGTAWVDGIELVEWQPKAEGLSPAAAAFLDEAMEKIRSNALHADRIDWERARRRALVRAGGARTPAETYDAVRFLLLSLGDRHSFLRGAHQASQSASNRRTDDFGQASERVLGKGWLRVPGYMNSHPERNQAFADELRARIARLAESRPCGWIVDLRQDTGGNMYPMLAGLAPFLGEDVLGYFVRGLAMTPWSLKGLRERMGLDPGDAGLQELLDAPVAVLTGPNTASSGEAVTLSFRNRPNTRSFGSPTNGRSTANRSLRLSDGSVMALTVSVMADRTGAAHGGGPIEPEEAAPSAAGAVPLAEDPVVIAASRWLDEQWACRTRPARS